VDRRWNTDLNKLEQTNKKLLADVLTDASRPLCSVYGAVVGLLAFGLNVITSSNFLCFFTFDTDSNCS